MCLWALPGGAQDLGESTTDAVVREVREEMGLDIHPSMRLRIEHGLADSFTPYLD